MKNIVLLLVLFVSVGAFSQQSGTDYQKRILESTEVDILSSYYSQTGNNAAVTGGIGTEELTDVAPTIIVSIPLNTNDALTVDAGFSTYTSASSSNLDPFDGVHGGNGLSGASSSDDDDDNNVSSLAGGSPWMASSGASRQDTWASISASYAHNSDDRNNIWNANVSFATEYDYSSIGFGGGFTKLFNEKNTELGVKANIYLDTWLPRYPTELDTYLEENGNLNNGFFSPIDILDAQGEDTDKSSNDTWSPISGFELINDKTRNTYSLSLSFSQILSKKAQISVFMDIVQQQGWLANPMQRVYFGDTPNYFIGNASNIPNYTSPDNTNVFMLADDIERLPNNRLKLPIGMRLHYYINETIALRTYYRYYFDDWGLNAHTLNLEVPIKISSQFTLYPSYRFYNQTQADYFAPFDTHLSTSEFYTSDYDLSAYSANQYGFGVSYTDIFTKFKILKFGLKSIDFKYNNYQRNTGLKANYIGLGFKFVMD